MLLLEEANEHQFVHHVLEDEGSPAYAGPESWIEDPNSLLLLLAW